MGTTTGRPFIKGLELSRFLYEEAVGPLMATHFAGLPYSAALLGSGSDVLGFDTPQSMDHDWGPRLLVFLGEADHARWRDEIDKGLERYLPHDCHGYPTRFEFYEGGTTAMAEDGQEPAHHRVMLLTVRSFFWDCLAFDPQGELRAVDWLTFPEQRLRGVTAGQVFHDGLGELEPVRARLQYYPRDVWLYLLAAQWRRIGQEEAFMGRCGQVGDELGSCLVAARLVRDLMKLCFLMERQYAPYSKWFGSAFAQLACAGQLAPTFASVLGAGFWQERERRLVAAYEAVARMHNALGVTEPLPTNMFHYFERPFLVIGGDGFADTLRAVIVSEEVQALPEYLGAVDQLVDSTDVLERPARCRRLEMLWQESDA